MSFGLIPQTELSNSCSSLKCESQAICGPDLSSDFSKVCFVFLKSPFVQILSQILLISAASRKGLSHQFSKER